MKKSMNEEAIIYDEQVRKFEEYMLDFLYESGYMEH